ncbi:DUF3301 domain-containing protein [Endothiovibrio diazotrophicus]
MDNILFLLLLGAVIWAWMDNLRAREAAVRAAGNACRLRGVQLLDETVGLAAVKLRRDVSGRLRFARRYRFEFSANGVHRSLGEVKLLGHILEGVEMSFANAPLEGEYTVEPPTPPPPSRPPPKLPLGWKVIDGGAPPRRDD